MQLIIINASGEEVKVPFLRDEISVGRQEGNTIRLQDRNISRRHARLKRLADKVFVEDLDSYNGVMLNGNKVTRREVVYVGDTIQVGDFTIKFGALNKDALAPVNLDGVQAHSTPAATGQEPKILSPTESRQLSSGSLQTVRDYSTGPYKSVQESPDTQLPASTVQEPDNELVDMGPSQPTIGDDDDQRHRVPTRPTSDDENIPDIEVELHEPRQQEPEPEPEPQAQQVEPEPRVDERHRVATIPVSDLEQTAAEILEPVDEVPVAAGAVEDTRPAVAQSDLTAQQDDTRPNAALPSDSLELQQAPDLYRPPLTTEYSLRNTKKEMRRRSLLPVLGIVLVIVVAAAGYFGYTKYREQQLLDEAVMLAGDAKAPPVPTPEEVAKKKAPVEEAPALVAPPTPDNPGAPMLSKDEIDSYISRAKKFLKLRKWEDAQEAMAQILREIPDHEIAMDLRDEAKREAKCERLLMNATKMYHKAKYDAALLQLTEIGDESVFYTKAQKLMGTVQGKIVKEYYKDARRAYKKRQYASAVRTLERLLAMDPGHKGGNKLLPKAVRARNKQQAKKEAAEESKGEAAELMREGGLLFRNRNYAKAAKIYKKVITIEPANAMAYRSLGSCYAAMGKPDRAVRAYEKYIKFSPNAADVPQVKQIIQQYKSNKQ